jgi:tetratricopeptide (TPR) repeat protein
MSDDLKSLYERGKELFERGLYSEAELFLKKVIEENPNYADVHNKLGVIYELRGRKQKAREHFERALELNPNYTEAALNLAITLSDMGDAEGAQEILIRIKETNKGASGGLDPFVAGKLANEHFRLGNIYYDFSLLDEAIEQYKRAVDLRPNLTDIQTKLGIALRESGRPDEAIEQLIVAKEENPKYCPAVVQLGLSYYMKGQKEKAIKEWESVLTVDPDHKEAKTFLVLAKKEG